MSLSIGQFVRFPSQAMYNAAIDMANESGVQVFRKTNSTRRWERYPCLKFGEKGLAGYRPEEGDDFDEISLDQFVAEVQSSALKQAMVASVELTMKDGTLRIGPFTFNPCHVEEIKSFLS